MVQTVKQKQVAKRKSVAKKTHAQADKVRAQKVVDIKALFLQEKDNPVVLAIIEHAKLMAAMHVDVGRNGVGARKTGEKYENGTDVVENVFLSNNKRVSELDRSAGILEITDWIERQMTPPSDAVVKKAK